MVTCSLRQIEHFQPPAQREKFFIPVRPLAGAASAAPVAMMKEKSKATYRARRSMSAYFVQHSASIHAAESDQIVASMSDNEISKSDQMTHFRRRSMANLWSGDTISRFGLVN